jgi:hypothetical protein
MICTSVPERKLSRSDSTNCLNWSRDIDSDSRSQVEILSPQPPMPPIPSRQAARPLEGGRASFCRRRSSKSRLDGLGVRFPVHSRWAAARSAGNESSGGSFRRRQCRFFGRLGTNSPTAKVRMPSTMMTPGAMLVRRHIRIRCCTLLRRRLLVIRLGHRQILRRCNCRQRADNQGAAYKSGIHASLRVLLQIRMPMLSVHSPARWARENRPIASAWTPVTAAITTARAQLHANSIDASAICRSGDNLVVKMTRTPCPGRGQRQVQ